MNSCGFTGWPLMGVGVLCGYLGAAPAIVWASGLLFAAAFFVLVPIAIWIYTLVFSFSALWFAHYCLDALAQLRMQRAAAAVYTTCGRVGRCQRCRKPMGCPMSRSFALIVVGDEILSGKRIDKHMPKVIQLLAERGLNWVGPSTSAMCRSASRRRWPALSLPATSCSRLAASAPRRMTIRAMRSCRPGRTTGCTPRPRH